MSKFSEYDFRLREELDNLSKCIQQIHEKLEDLKGQYQRLNLLDAMNNPQPKNKSDDLHQANKMRAIYECFGRGLNSWETAEECQGYFKGSVWDAYNTISDYRNREEEMIRYARSYLVQKLALFGMKYVEISKITGYSPQRCGQITRNFKKDSFFTYRGDVV